MPGFCSDISRPWLDVWGGVSYPPVFWAEESDLGAKRCSFAACPCSLTANFPRQESNEPDSLVCVIEALGLGAGEFVAEAVQRKDGGLS